MATNEATNITVEESGDEVTYKSEIYSERFEGTDSDIGKIESLTSNPDTLNMSNTSKRHISPKYSY